MISFVVAAASFAAMLALAASGFVAGHAPRSLVRVREHR
jgi:hypothetical protein